MSKKRSLRFSLFEGIFTSLNQGFTTDYVTPFALILGAANAHIGILSAVPQLVGAAVQLRTARIARLLGSRQKTVVGAMAFQALIYFLLGLVIFIPENLRAAVFIGLMILYQMMGSVYAPAWSSLMSDTVDGKRYGRYFAWRGKILGLVSMLCGFASGLILTFIPEELTGFLILFTAGGLFKTLSCWFMSRMEDIKVEIHTEKNHFFSFLKDPKEKNFLNFIFFVALMNFTIFLASPFFSVYMLSYLGVSYITYSVLTSATALASLFSLPFWGKMADRYGNAGITKAAGALLPITPVFWLMSRNPVFLFIAKGLSGYLAAGFALATVNFIYDSSSSEKRTAHVAFYNFIIGIFIFGGSLAGGLLSTILPPVMGSSLLTLFLVSAVLRAGVFSLMHSRFEEVRESRFIRKRRMILKIIRHPVYYFIRPAREKA